MHKYNTQDHALTSMLSVKNIRNDRATGSSAACDGTRLDAY